MNQATKNNFVFILGREQEIALAELKAVLVRFGFYFPARPAGGDIYKITGNQVFANIDNFTVNDAVKVMDALAGTIKIYKLEGPIEKDIASQISSIFRSHKVNGEGKINFAISYFGRGFSRQNINSIALTAKKQLKSDFSLRYVESRDSSELSSILTLKNNLATKGIEFGLFDNEIGILVALNNPEEWSKRDYDKPASDKFSGMLPPKLARMMINLALGCHPELACHGDMPVVSGSHNEKMLKQVQHDNGCLVLDPFCGSGNVLMEAMMLGCDAVGSDISEKAVEDTKVNIEWLKNQNTDNRIQISVFQADAMSEEYIKKLTTDNCELITGYKNLVFVTEPYLGEPKKFKPTYNAAAGEYLKIKELYINFLKNVKNVILNVSEESKNNALLDPSAVPQDDKDVILCIVFPLVETTEGKRFSLFGLSVDEIRELGYTQVRPSMIYGRDYQVVKREIVLLKSEQI